MRFVFNFSSVQLREDSSHDPPCYARDYCTLTQCNIMSSSLRRDLVCYCGNVCWSDIVERPCGQLPPAEQAATSRTDGNQAANSPDGDSVPQDGTDHDHVFNEKYISDRDLPESRRTNRRPNNAAILTVACAAFYLVLSAVFYSIIRSAF